jgi:hypothetical protein
MLAGCESDWSRINANLSRDLPYFLCYLSEKLFPKVLCYAGDGSLASRRVFILRKGVLIFFNFLNTACYLLLDSARLRWNITTINISTLALLLFQLVDQALVEKVFFALLFFNFLWLITSYFQLTTLAWQLWISILMISNVRWFISIWSHYLKVFKDRLMSFLVKCRIYIDLGESVLA